MSERKVHKAVPAEPEMRAVFALAGRGVAWYDEAGVRHYANCEGRAWTLRESGWEEDPPRVE